MAEIHRVGQTYAGPAGRFQLDIQHLVDRPLAALLVLPTLDPDDRDFFAAFAMRLVERFDAAKGALAWGHCHGDCHGFNARITEIGLSARTAAFFDFDDGGPGWLGYDLAVYLWNKVLNPGTLNLWPSFLEGYLGKGVPVPAGADRRFCIFDADGILLAGRADACRRQH